MGIEQKSSKELVAEYQEVVTHVAKAAIMIAVFDLPKQIRYIEAADSFGLIMDPTLWRDGRKRMMEDLEMLRAALPLWKLAENVLGVPPDVLTELRELRG